LLAAGDKKFMPPSSKHKPLQTEWNLRTAIT